MTQKAAIGLLYDGKNAPSVSVKGFGVLAEEILALAKEKNILIHQDEGLSDVIKQLELGQEIPRELYLTGALFNHRRVNCFFICPARKVSSRLATTQQ